MGCGTVPSSQLLPRLCIFVGNKPKMDKGFFDHLDSLALTNNSKATYLSTIMSALNTAVKDGLIPANPISCYKRYYKTVESCRAYLTIEELKKIAATPMQHIGISVFISHFHSFYVCNLVVFRSFYVYIYSVFHSLNVNK